jgi:glycine/D-amino acid oxidase-like deaminating enzyme
MTPDCQFIVDHHPASERVAFAAGLSGHGFKFSPVLGEILADLVLTGATTLDIEFLGRTRTALRTQDNNNAN